MSSPPSEKERRDRRKQHRDQSGVHLMKAFQAVTECLVNKYSRFHQAVQEEHFKVVGRSGLENYRHGMRGAARYTMTVSSGR